MKTLILILFTSITFAQSDLNHYVKEFNACNDLNIDNIKQIVYTNTNKPFELLLTVEKDSLCYFTIELNKRLKNERQIVFKALKICVQETILISDVRL